MEKTMLEWGMTLEELLELFEIEPSEVFEEA